MNGWFKLPKVVIPNKKTLLNDGEDGIKSKQFLSPVMAWGHVVYLIDDDYLFSADTIWLGADGGYSFINKREKTNLLLDRLQG